MNVYGVLLNGCHIDVSSSERGAKQFATRNGYDVVTCRYDCGYIAAEIAQKKGGKWIRISEGQKRYKN